MSESGRLENDMAFVEIGSGAKNVLVLPGYEGELLNTPAHPFLTKVMLRGFDTADCSVRYVGRKPDTPEGYTTRDMAEDYADIMRPNTHIIGISLGGMVAQHLADISNKVRTMTICNSGPDDSERAERTLSENLDNARAGDWDGFYNGMLWDVDSWLKRKLSYFGFSIERFRNEHYRAEVIHGGRAAENHESWDILEQINIPVFLITGTQDSSYPPEILKKADKKLATSQLEIVDADHEYFYSDTADFSKRWKEFESTH